MSIIVYNEVAEPIVPTPGELLILGLFARGERGGAWDFTSPGRLYQDSDGATPVTSYGDPIGLAMDLSPNENHLRQQTTTARPSYTDNGMETDGVDDTMVSLDFPASLGSGWYFGVAVNRLSVNSARPDCRITANSGPNDYLELNWQTSERAQFRIRGLSVDVDSTAAMTGAGALPLNTTSVIEGWITESQIFIAVSGQQFTANHSLGTIRLGTSLRINLPLTPTQPRIYRRVFTRDKIPTEGERLMLRAWLMGGV